MTDIIARYYKTYILAAILILILLLSCCTISSSSYKTITVENEICSYLLEYPRCYKKTGPSMDRDPVPSWTGFDLHAPVIKEPIEFIDISNGKMKTGRVSYTPAYISIFISVADESSEEFNTSRERLEWKLESEARREGFELLERSPAVVSGIEGEMIVYLKNKIIPTISFKENPERLEYHRKIYFDYNGLIWIIQASCNQEMADQVNADFDHIIQTFKILE